MPPGSEKQAQNQNDTASIVAIKMNSDRLTSSFFENPEVHDALQQYISPKHNLHAVCTGFRKLYTTFDLSGVRCYKGYITLPEYSSDVLQRKLASLVQKEAFAINLSELTCFRRIVYNSSSSKTDLEFAQAKESMSACVEQIYIDCHWVGYVHVRHKDRWIVNPIYRKEHLSSETPFDFDVYKQELLLYLAGWANLKEVCLFGPFAKRPFLKCLFKYTWQAVQELREALPNPHHLKVMKVDNVGLKEIDGIANLLQFLKNVDSRVSR